jgi:hypothetical protein
MSKMGEWKSGNIPYCMKSCDCLNYKSKCKECFKYDCFKKKDGIPVCGMCQFLVPLELEQTDKKEPHICTKLGIRLSHNGYHPAIPCDANCPFKEFNEHV